MRQCPNCGGPVDYSLACHTYPQTSQGKTTWMSCMPCDSAYWWTCEGHNEDRCEPGCYEYGIHEGCGWNWTEGLNPGNPRAIANEENNPHWEE